MERGAARGRDQREVNKTRVPVKAVNALPYVLPASLPFTKLASTISSVPSCFKQIRVASREVSQQSEIGNMVSWCTFLSLNTPRMAVHHTQFSVFCKC
jgi:hypothetical protein